MKMKMSFHSLNPQPCGPTTLHRDLARAFAIDRATDHRGEAPPPITLRKFSWQKEKPQ